MSYPTKIDVSQFPSAIGWRKAIWDYKAKTLKSQLLKKLSIKFFETQDLSSPYRKPKLLFEDYSCVEL